MGSEITAPKKHSLLGVLSIAFSLFFCLLISLSFVVAPVYFMGPAENIVQSFIISAHSILSLLSLPIALALGIAAMLQKNTKRVFAFLSVGISAMLLCLATLLVAFIYILQQ